MSIRRFQSKLSILQLSVAFVAMALLTACQQQEAEAPVEAPPERVENAALAVAIADLPSLFQVQTNDGAVLDLVPSDPALEGVLSVATHTPETAGINLVAAVERHKADIESRVDGAFKGQRELGTPMGTAFYSRGHFTADGRAMEETAVFMIHPAGDRELHLVYVYPAGDDTASRLQDQLFEVLGEIEGLAVAETPAADAEAAGDEPSADAATG